MAQILPRFDPGGEAGKSFGGGLGEGLAALSNRKILQGGIENLRSTLQDKMAQGEQLNPLDVTLSAMGIMAPHPGGLQALAELAPSIQKEVLRSNFMNQQRAGQPGQSDQQGVMGQPGQQGDQQGREGIRSKDKYQENVRKYMDLTQDPELATKLAIQEQQTEISEEGRRANQQKVSQDFFKDRIKGTFKEGLDPIIADPTSKKFFDMLQTTDENTAWNKLKPELLAQQSAVENLKNSTAATRPLLWTGDIDTRSKSARQALEPIIKLSEDAAIGLAQDDLDYGVTEAHKIVRPGTKDFNQFVTQIGDNPMKNVPFPIPGDKNLEKYYNSASKKLEHFLSNNFDPNKDSLLALMGELDDKGYSQDRFLESVNKVFPQGINDERLSEFNRREYPKLQEPIQPGMQDIFNNLLRATPVLPKILSRKLRGKR